jgi:PAS domain S-box-containing protein
MMDQHFIIYAILMSFLSFLIYERRSFKKLRKESSDELKYINFIISNLSIPWCLWNTKRTIVESSSSFKEMLSFDDNIKISMEDVFKKLKAGTFSPLAKSVNHLLEYGGLFNLQITLEENQKEIKIFGKIITFQSDFGPVDLVLLTFLDVTKNFENESQSKNLIQHLKVENDMLNFIINESPLAIWHRNLQGCISYCNASYAGALGSSVSKVIAENLELISPTQCNLFELSRQALLHGEKMTSRIHTVIEGHRRLLEISEIPMKDSGTTIGFAADITEIEELEKQIKKTKKAYRDILDVLSIPIAVFDESRHLSYHNLAYQQLFEFTDQILSKKPTLGELLDDLRKRRKIQEYHSFQEHKRERNELFNNLLSPIEEVSYLPDGKTLRIRISPYPLGGILFIFENLTNQLDLERDVNTLQAVQKTTLDHLREGILVIGSDGKIRLFNPAVKLIWGVQDEYDNQDIHIQTLLNHIKLSFMDENQHLIWQQQLFKRFSERHPVTERLYLINNQVVEWFYVPLPDGSHMLGFVDVSDEWHHEQQLKSRNMMLEMTHKLKADYLNDINSEIKTPLNDIIGFSHTLSQQIFGNLNEKQNDYCKLIHEKAMDIEKIFENVFELLRIDFDHIDIRKEKIELHNFFNDFEQLIQKKANEMDVDCVIKCDIKSKIIEGDSKRLQQALWGVTTDVFKKIPQKSLVNIIIKIQNAKLFYKINYQISEKSHVMEALYLGKKIASIIFSHHKGTVTEKRVGQEQTIECSIPLD